MSEINFMPLVSAIIPKSHKNSCD